MNARATDDQTYQSMEQEGQSYSRLLGDAELGQTPQGAQLAQTMANKYDLASLGRSLGVIAESLRGYGGVSVSDGAPMILNGVAAGSDGVSLGTWKELLARNVGRSCVVSFLIGTQGTVTAEGTLLEVGTDYLVLRRTARQGYLSADLYAVKFVEFRGER